MLLNAVTLGGYHFLVGSDWPIVTTTTWLGVTCVSITAGLWWLRDCRLSRLALAVALVAAWIFWIVSHFYPEGLRGPFQMWRRFSAADVAVLLTATVAAVDSSQLGIFRIPSRRTRTRLADKAAEHGLQGFWRYRSKT